ncbi:MAG: SPOR domain-containing protein [Azoarcus sp.]|jgi:DedD protein|nr:SPOR domain-containing protein [Azoarcus sp.]MDX9838137.1 SPOR domain-containing protein [Azoarcus sp.]
MSAMTTEQIRLQRRQALKRAGLASAVAVALLLAVLIFEDSRSPAADPSTELAPPSQPVLSTAVVAPVESAAVVVETEQEGAQPAQPEGDPLPAQPAVAEPAPSPAAKQASVPLANGYLVQLGVFGSMDNADSLRADVAARGLPAHVEGRVVVGPFPHKAAAEAARARLKREGLAAGIVVPPRKSK